MEKNENNSIEKFLQNLGIMLNKASKLYDSEGHNHQQVEDCVKKNMNDFKADFKRSLQNCFETIKKEELKLKWRKKITKEVIWIDAQDYYLNSSGFPFISGGISSIDERLMRNHLTRGRKENTFKRSPSVFLPDFYSIYLGFMGFMGFNEGKEFGFDIKKKLKKEKKDKQSRDSNGVNKIQKSISLDEIIQPISKLEKKIDETQKAINTQSIFLHDFRRNLEEKIKPLELKIDELKLLVKESKISNLNDPYSEVEIQEDLINKILNGENLDEEIIKLSKLPRKVIFSIALSLFEREDYQSVIKLLSSSQTSKKKGSNNWFLLGITYIVIEEYQCAKDILLKIVGAQPKNSKVLYLLGYVNLKLKDNKLSINFLNRAVKLAPLNSRFWYDLGILYYDDGNFDKAIESLENAILNNGKNVSYLVQLGLLYGITKNYSKAIKCYENVILIDNENAESFYLLGHTYFLIEEYKKAGPYLKKAIKLHPTNSKYWVMKGIVSTLMSDYKLTIFSYINALYHLPNQSTKRLKILGLLGETYILTKNYINAIKLFKEVLKLTPENDNYWFLLGRCYALTKDYIRAIEKMNMAVKYNDKNGEYWYYLGLSYGMIKDYENAKKSYLMAFLCSPNNSKYLNVLQMHLE